METGSPWFVVRVRPQPKHIDRAGLNVRNQGGEFYSPQAMVPHPRRRAFRLTQLFPGYAFVRHPGGRWVFLQGTIGVMCVLMSTGDAPALLPDSEVRKIRAREGPDGLVHFAIRGFSAGEVVHVDKGSLTFDALVEGMSGPDRVFVLMHILGQWSRAEVGVADLRR